MWHEQHPLMGSSLSVSWLKGLRRGSRCSKRLSYGGSRPAAALLGDLPPSPGHTLMLDAASREHGNACACMMRAAS
ncbi:hypothetical protein MRX96_010359 [Rhipicephalus microplus]